MKIAHLFNGDFNISLLREYVVLAQLLSFSKAAKELNTTQSTLSRHLAELEKSMGTVLIKRTTGGSELTENGKIFLKEADRILQGIDSAYHSLSPTTSRERNIITLDGCVHWGLAAWVPYVLNKYRLERKPLEFSWRPQNYLSFDEMLHKSKANAIFTYLLDSVDTTGFVVEPLFRDRLAIALAADHPLATQKTVSLDELKHDTFLDMTGFSAYSVLPRVRELYEKRGIKPKTVLSLCESFEQTLNIDCFSPHFVPMYSKNWYPVFSASVITCKALEDEDCYLDYALVYRESAENSFVKKFVSDLRKQPFPEGLEPLTRDIRE